MKSITIRIYLILVTSLMTIALTPKPEFIWYLYPKWNGQLYGYRPKTNVSYFPESVVGQVVVQEEGGIHDVYLEEAASGANKIVLGNLSDNLGNSAAFPTFTISFLFKFDYPLPQASKLRVFNAIPNRELRANSNPLEIYLIQIGENVTLHAAVGQYNSVTEAARAYVPPVNQWIHAVIVYHDSHDNETEIYLNGSRVDADIYQAPMNAEPPNAKPFEYTIGHDNGPASLSLSWFQLIKETLTAEQAKELSDNTFNQALQAVQVGVKFTTTSRRVEEDIESIDLLVMRTGNVEIASIVRFSATSGTAKINKDFTFPSSDDFVFKPGEVYGSINVPILSDDYTEDDENFTISIKSVDGGVTTVTEEGTVTITIASNIGPSGREGQDQGQVDEDCEVDVTTTCLIPLILLCVAIALVSLGIIILIVFLITLCRS